MRDTTPTPLHRRVYDELVARIADGSLPPGSRLPPERQLCEELGVSRSTLRKALAALAADGAVDPVQGSGTYTTAVHLAEPPNTLLGFSRLAEMRGLAATAIVVAEEVRPATISESELLGLAPGAPLLALERLRMLDALPVAIGRSLVPLACAPVVADQDWATASLYDVLAAAGCAPTWASYSIEAHAADDHASELLAVAAGSPVLVTESTVFAADGTCVEQCHMVYRGDRYRFRSTLTAQLAAAHFPAALHTARRERVPVAVPEERGVLLSGSRVLHPA